jgi:outer membrane protein assembly factor BamB
VVAGTFTDAVAADDTVFAGTSDGTLFALAAGTGRRRFAYDTGGHIRHGPAVANGLAFVTAVDSDGTRATHALGAADGDARWRYRSDSKDDAAPVVAGGVVYAGREAVTANDGVWLWSLPSSRTVATPGIASGALYATNGSELLRFD